MARRGAREDAAGSGLLPVSEDYIPARRIVADLAMIKGWKADEVRNVLSQTRSDEAVRMHRWTALKSAYSSKLAAVTFKGLASFSTIEIVGFLAARSMSLT